LVWKCVPDGRFFLSTACLPSLDDGRLCSLFASRLLVLKSRRWHASRLYPGYKRLEMNRNQPFVKASICCKVPESPLKPFRPPYGPPRNQLLKGSLSFYPPLKKPAHRGSLAIFFAYVGRSSLCALAFCPAGVWNWCLVPFLTNYCDYFCRPRFQGPAEFPPGDGLQRSYAFFSFFIAA